MPPWARIFTFNIQIQETVVKYEFKVYVRNAFSLKAFFKIH